ncbi:hypothetical protein CYMTET_14182 [Cymbomonas tetramitiformis]|uniref:Uncharacterized protein n=1 Tax=Cymbomonas tetramitiformis TaxID=36881 RepID=A0AAE0GH54_9CHLO|nr:hypothetical protein CYMTET_14182 [Cymbomonas tetramitiformis]
MQVDLSNSRCAVEYLAADGVSVLSRRNGRGNGAPGASALHSRQIRLDGPFSAGTEAVPSPTDSPEAYAPPVVEEGEGGDFAFLSPTALEALLRGSGGERGAAYLSDGEDPYHRIARGSLVTPSLHAVFAAGLVGESGEIMDPVPIIQTMEVEDDSVARDGLGVAEAATALPAEVVRAEYVEAAGGAVDRPGYDRGVAQLSSGCVICQAGLYVANCLNILIY